MTFLVSFSTTIFALRCAVVGEPLRERGLRDVPRCEAARGGVRDRLRYGEREREAERGVIDRRGVREGDLEGMAELVIAREVVMSMMLQVVTKKLFLLVSICDKGETNKKPEG